MMRTLNKLSTAAVALACVIATCAAATAFAETPSQKVKWTIPPTPAELALNFGAQMLCGEHFISGRPAERIIKETVGPLLMAEGGPLRATAAEVLGNAHIDQETRVVTLRSGPFVGRSRHLGDQGCVMLPNGRVDPFFTPRRVRSKTERAAERLPRLAADATAARYDSDKFEAAERAVMASYGTAFLVVQRGEVVYEAYADGVTPETPLLNWSMGKSIIGTLIGRLAHMGDLTLDDAVDLPEFPRAADDPRRNIKIADYMRMSSGLRCTDDSTPIWERYGPANDHTVIYQRPMDVIRHAFYAPVRAAPNEVPDYSNCDMQALGGVIRAKIAARGDDYLSWPYRNLYDLIGMVGMVSETDAYGNFHLTGYDYGSAEAWARFGLLYLNDGEWRGERLLPEGWATFVSTPAPAWRRRDEPSVYGGTFWVSANSHLPLPPDAYWAAGAFGNFAIVVPSLDAVIVILRRTAFSPEMGDNRDEKTREALALIVDALAAR